MANDDDTVRYTAEEIEAMRARGESRTDHDRLARMTDADIEAQAADEPEFDWANVYPGIPLKITWRNAPSHPQRLCHEYETKA